MDDRTPYRVFMAGLNLTQKAAKASTEEPKNEAA